MHYLPYGQLLANQSPSGYDERFKFIGKERDWESGYDYFGARYYISPFLHWMSVDPLSDEDPGISPYAYCHWNPIKRVDYNGKDDWEIDQGGDVLRRIPNHERDAFFIVDKDGNRIEGKGVILKYGSVESYKHGNLEGGGSYDAYQIRGDENGKNVFEFFADNTSVEWSHYQMGEEGDHGLNSISTSHETGKDRSGSFLYDKKFRYGYYIRRHNHNHPNNSDIPSGIGYKNKGDVGFGTVLARNARNRGHAIPKFYIYLPLTKEYVPYNYLLKTDPPMLPELTSTP